MDKQPVGQLPDLTQSNNDDEIMVITNDEYNQLKKEKISDFITDLTSTDENNAIVKGTDGKLFTKDFGNASNITEGTLPVSVLPDIPKDKLPEIETDDLPDSGITAGTYTYPTDIVVNSKGQVTSITEGQVGANNANQDLSNLGPLGLDKINQSKALETGAVSSDADVYADIQKYAHSTFDLSKFEVVGSPTITDDGIASGFSAEDSVKIPNKYFPSNLSALDISLLINTQNLSNTNQGVFGCQQKENTSMAMLDVRATNSGGQLVYSTGLGTQKAVAFTAQWLGQGKDKINFKINNSKIELFINEELSLTVNDFVYVQPINFYIGSNRSKGDIFQGSIALKSIAVWADGVPVFNGNKTGLYIAKPDNYEVVGSPTITD